MNKKIRILLVGVAAMALVGAGCVKQGAQTTADTSPIKIGWLSPLTGDVAAVGTAMKDSVAMAVEEINTQGGINGRNLEVVYEDGACDAKTASLAGNKLVNVDKVAAIIGGACTGETMAFAQAAEQNKVVVISPASTAPSVTTAGDYIFRVVPSDSFQGKYAANFVYNTLGKRKAAMLYAQVDYTEGLAAVFSEEFKRLGGEVVVSESFLKEARDLKTQLTKIKDAGADVLYFATYTEAGVAGLKQAQELGLNIQVIGPESFDDPKFHSTPGINGAIYTVPASLSSDEFKNKYLTKTSRADMPVYVTQSYDIVNLLAQVMKKVGAKGEDVKNELYKVKDYQGVSGVIGFDENGDLMTANYEVKTIVGNKPQKYQSQ